MVTGGSCAELGCGVVRCGVVGGRDDGGGGGDRLMA